ncbi:hypothetical protein EMIT047CA2_20109 [Pseudomonas soli]
MQKYLATTLIQPRVFPGRYMYSFLYGQSRLVEFQML